MRKFPAFILVVLLGALLVSCGNTRSPRAAIIQDPSDLLHDHFFIVDDENIPLLDESNLFELPENYKRELDRILATAESEYERYSKVRAWIYRRFKDYDFDITETYSLAELNANRKINCLSFSTLFVAAARYANVPADFQLVLAPPYWDKNGSSWINNQHINVTGAIDPPPTTSFLDRKFGSANPSYFRNGAGLVRDDFFMVYRTATSDYRYTADINPAIVSIPVRRQIIDEQQVLSLYYSNKSVEALLSDSLNLAYRYTKRALETDSDSAIAWNNLGVLYGRVGQPELSIAAYERAIALDERIYSATSNLANSYRLTGQIAQAELLENEIESFRNMNPYYHSALADDNIAEGEYDKAIGHLEKALSQKHNEQYFYHQMAVVNQQLGDMDSVIENLDRARRFARGNDKARFAGKLRALEEISLTRN